MSGDNHWLEDLAKRHATVAPESAGMETRLLQEIARLQKALQIIAGGINLKEHASEIGIDCSDLDNPALVMRRIAAYTLKDGKS